MSAPFITYPEPPRRPFPTRPLAIIVSLATVLAAVLQLLAPSWDHQLANVFTALTVLVALLLIGVVVYRHERSNQHRNRFPIAVIVGLAVLSLLFKFDGFSGEMRPLISFRFSADKPPLTTQKVDSSRLAKIDMSSPAATALSDWTQFLGPHRDGTIDRREFAIPSSLADVEEVWRQPIGEGWASFAVLADRAVTLEQRGDEECLACYRLADGALLWILSHKARHENPLGGVGPRSTPSIRDGRVFAQGATGHLWCVELNSGEVVWTQDLLKLAGWDKTASEVAAPWGRATSPLLVDNLCIVGFGAPTPDLPKGIDGRSLIALNVDTGEMVWTAGDEQLSYGSPTTMTIGDDRHVVAVNEATITGHSLADGETLWSFPWPGQTNGAANCTQAIPVGENQFLVSKGYGGGSALVIVTPIADDKPERDQFNVDTQWTSNRVLKTKFTHALVQGDVAYALSDGSLQAVNIADGDLLWQQPRMSRAGQGQAILVEDTLIVQNETGGVLFVAADASEYREICRLDALSDRTWNIPTIAGRHLLVRNDREAVCYLLPSREGS